MRSGKAILGTLLLASCLSSRSQNITVPRSAPSGSASVDPALLSLSIEFFAFPGYTELTGTANCIANLATLRGTPPAVRIGGTTQDRATYDASLAAAVEYTVASPADAPDSLTYGPAFFELAQQLGGEITLGLNRQLNNQTNSLAAAQRAAQVVQNLFAIELGNEPDLYASNSPIVPTGATWGPDTDAASEKAWFAAFAPTLGNVFQGAVYISWTVEDLLDRIGSGIANVKTVSRHSYPQSACGGASTNLEELMSHSGIVSYVTGFESEAAATYAAGKPYFFGETNSATCGGGGISPTFGAALWIVDYVLQSALIGTGRLYFHQGTISNCAYCFWGNGTVFSPYYGAVFVSQFLGTDGTKLAMLDDGEGAIGAYAVFSASGLPLRVLVTNSNYYDGTGVRTNTTVSLTGLTTTGRPGLLRFTAPDATAQVDQGSAVTIGGGGSFNPVDCTSTGRQVMEVVEIVEGAANVTLRASEAAIIVL
ncbi:glycoside hydrolase family 79 protein [Gelatoporia subvermispora B]|uniref:Glycoside hydrolase family 79 protein n=1 Tax=Ceriporiopsis subvermispora (strain B) TaxID=914234 RepID=M2QKP2_CERS8|nr:glycoside hydrolase family 79 protein [Gelatoporia subvermispora B]